MHALTVAASEWWSRPRGPQRASWIDTYQKSLRQPHRDALVDVIAGLGVESVLEVGSHCGPNLVRLAQSCPSLSMLSGIDVSAEAIGAGQQWVASLGLSDRVELVVGRMPEKTSALPDGCVDVVLSSYALAYIAPQDLDAVLYEMGRLAKRAVVLAEPMTTDATATTTARLDYSEWAHNYQSAAKWVTTWRGGTYRQVAVSPPVGRLSSVLVMTR